MGSTERAKVNCTGPRSGCHRPRRTAAGSRGGAPGRRRSRSDSWLILSLRIVKQRPFGFLALGLPCFCFGLRAAGRRSLMVVAEREERLLLQVQRGGEVGQRLPDLFQPSLRAVISTLPRLPHPGQGG